MILGEDMNKFVILGICLAIIISVIILLIPKNNAPKELVLTYEINAGIPFKWVYEIEDESIVGFIKSYVQEDDSDEVIDGGSIYTNYVFKGLKEGETTIIFKEISMEDEEDIVKEEKTRVKVDKDNNISIVESK